MGEGSLRGCPCYSKNHGQLLHHSQRRGIARGTDTLGAGIWFPIGKDVDFAIDMACASTASRIGSNAGGVPRRMTETRTLQFESPRALQSLYANDLRLLKNLEDSLGVKVTTREGWVKLEGEPSRIDKAQHVFDQLEKARQKGVDIQKHEFNYALNSVNEERNETLGDIASSSIVSSPRKSPIMARSAGQRNYVEAIQKHDIV